MPVLPPSPDPHASTVRCALWLPIFDELSDPRTVATIAVEAESAGWDGLFVWDHIRWREPVRAVADPWITLTAIATATRRLRFGPMVTPLARRRPAKVARETATLDQLSGGRLTLGVGLGSDRFGAELSKTAEQLDDRRRAAMLDEALAILRIAWSGEPVRHHGEHHVVDDIRFLPRPAQTPGVPVWVAAMGANSGPLRRAARHDGLFPVNLEHPDQLADIVDRLTALRTEIGDDLLRRYDIAASIPPDSDPQAHIDAGATWILIEFDPHQVSADHVRAVTRSGPVTTGAQRHGDDHRSDAAPIGPTASSNDLEGTLQ